MKLNLLGYNLTIGKDSKDLNIEQSSDIEISYDGSHVVSGGARLNNDNYADVNNESDVNLIKNYRQIAHFPEVATAIDEIMNEFVVFDAGVKPVTLDLTELSNTGDVSKKVIDELSDNFNELMQMLEFNKNGYKYIRDWYIDGNLPFYISYAKTGGISNITQLNPTRLKHIKIVKDEESTEIIDDFYIYERKSIKTNQTGYRKQLMTNSLFSGLYEKADIIFKVSPVAIINMNSGLYDKDSGVHYGYLHRAVRPANQLDSAESAIMIYRLARAHETRVIYVDTGNLPPHKAQLKIEQLRREFRRDNSYDVVRGTTTTNNRTMSIADDIVLGRSNGNKTAEITTIGGSMGSASLDDINMWRQKLITSLMVPPGRFNDAQSIFNNDSEISREELRFHRFITRLRIQFSDLFIELLRRHVVSKKIMSLYEFDSIRELLSIKYNKDNFFSELRDMEIMQLRLDLLSSSSDVVGKYISHKTLRQKVFGQTSEEIEQEDKLIEEESKLDKYKTDDF